MCVHLQVCRTYQLLAARGTMSTVYFCLNNNKLCLNWLQLYFNPVSVSKSPPHVKWSVNHPEKCIQAPVNQILKPPNHKIFTSRMPGFSRQCFQGLNWSGNSRVWMRRRHAITEKRRTNYCTATFLCGDFLWNIFFIKEIDYQFFYIQKLINK